MTPSLDVLIVDDDDFRSDMTATLLQEINPDISITVVENYKDFQGVLGLKKWALCVLDGEFPEDATSRIQYTEKPLGMKALTELQSSGYTQNHVVVLSGNDDMIEHSSNRGYRTATVSVAEDAVKRHIKKILRPEYEYHV